MRKPHIDDHENLRQMLVAFSDQSAQRMNLRNDEDVSLERVVISPLRRATDIRGRRKNARRFTAEMMRLIRDHYPVELRERDRARKMAQFVRELADQYLTNTSNNTQRVTDEHS